MALVLSAESLVDNLTLPEGLVAAALLPIACGIMAAPGSEIKPTNGFNVNGMGELSGTGSTEMTAAWDTVKSVNGEIKS